MLGIDGLYSITKEIMFELLSFGLGIKTSIWDSLHTSLNAKSITVTW